MTYSEFVQAVKELPEEVKRDFIRSHKVTLYTVNAKCCMPGTKINVVGSISLPVGLTCFYKDSAKCCRGCYAKRGHMNYHNMIDPVDILNSGPYVKNLIHWVIDPDDYWQQLDRDARFYEFVRVCDSGDWGFDPVYTQQLFTYFKRHPHLTGYAFTQFHHLAQKAPSNLIVRCSTLGRAECEYNHDSKLSVVVDKYSTIMNMTVPKNYKGTENRQQIDKINLELTQRSWFLCTGNCAECAKSDTGCFNFEYHICLIKQ